MTRLLLFLLTGMLFLLNGCGGDNSNSLPLDPEGSFFSFENDMQGWEAKGIDLDNPPVQWSIERSQERSRDGNTSLKLYLSNLNDAGKIWVERKFSVMPDRLYQIRVTIAFASADYGNSNLWTIIAGAAGKRPETSADLTYQGDTGNGAGADVGYQWLEKSYEFAVQSDATGNLYITLGVWGTWEGPRTYFIDSINASFTEQ